MNKSDQVKSNNGSQIRSRRSHNSEQISFIKEQVNLPRILSLNSTQWKNKKEDLRIKGYINKVEYIGTLLQKHLQSTRLASDNQKETYKKGLKVYNQFALYINLFNTKKQLPVNQIKLETIDKIIQKTIDSLN